MARYEKKKIIYFSFVPDRHESLYTWPLFFSYTYTQVVLGTLKVPESDDAVIFLGRTISKWVSLENVVHMIFVFDYLTCNPCNKVH